ncbi:MAG TPA: glycosyltransferase family 2 protein [Novimethylophilus sp.]|jgi:hypothetical protein|uniref:glycosyltransferase family 2 protein n=1 Tax=Novimethylophilus sp. TaxID=2137426 RepID=UPI002F3E8646
MNSCAIVLNYRNAERTEACLRSLVGQGIGAVLVVDNSADVRAAGELGAAIQRLQENLADFDLHVLTPAGNLGFARGVNAALEDERAKAYDIFLLINNDATAAPGMAGKLKAAMGDHHAAIALPSVRSADGLPQPTLWYQRYSGLMTAQPLPGSFMFPSGCCLMFGTASLTAGKLFDEDFFMYGEDVLLGWQLMHMGKAAYQVGEAVVYHAGSASSGKNGLFYEYHTARAHILLALKTWHYRLEIPLLLMAKSSGMLLRAVWRSLRWRSATPVLAFLLAWLPLNIRPDHGKRPD